MARLGYILAGVNILVLSAFFLSVLLRPIDDVDVIEVALSLFVLLVMLLIIYPVFDKLRNGTPLLPDDFLDAGGGTLRFGLISIWIGNFIALVPVFIIAILATNDAQGLMVGFPIGIAAMLYLYGFDAIGSARRKWEEDCFDDVERDRRPYRLSAAIGITVGLALLVIQLNMYSRTGGFGGLLLLSLLFVGFGLFFWFKKAPDTSP